jgi:tight adherence protein C
MNNYITIVIELLTFVIVGVIAMAAVRGIEGMITVRRRLGGQSATVSASSTSSTSVMKGRTVRNPFLLWVQSSTSLKNPVDRNKLRKALSYAGFDNPAAPVIYFVVRFSLAIGLPVLFLLGQKLLAKPMAGVPLIICALLACGLGLLLPHYFVTGRANGRKSQMEIEFPDALDLMVICVEAGLGLEAAFVRVAQEVKDSHPRIGEEFSRVSEEFRAGRGRADALRSMGERTNTETVKSFAALLIQTDALGTSIGRTLKSYSVEMRDHRFLKAEEKAMRIPVLMTMPLVACILPVIVAALLLPPIIDVMRHLMPAMSGK